MRATPSRGGSSRTCRRAALVVDAYKRAGLRRAGHRQSRVRLRSARHPIRGRRAARPARRAQGGGRPRAVSVPRGEPDRRGHGTPGGVAERPAVHRRRRRGPARRHRGRDDLRRAPHDPRRQRPGASHRRRSRPPSRRRRGGCGSAASTWWWSWRTPAGGARGSTTPPTSRRATTMARSSGWPGSFPQASWMRIVAGHSHAAVAHVVAGIPIVQAYSRGAAFARLDLTVERGEGGRVGAPLRAPGAVYGRRPGRGLRGRRRPAALRRGRGSRRTRR